jgi:signal transduction histidine kinase
VTHDLHCLALAGIACRPAGRPMAAARCHQEAATAPACAACDNASGRTDRGRMSLVKSAAEQERQFHEPVGAVPDTGLATRRIKRAMAAMMAALLVTAVLASVSVQQVLSNARAVIGRHAHNLYQAQELRIQLQRIIGADRGYLLTREREYLAEMDDSHRAFQQTAAELASGSVTPVGQSMLAEILREKSRHALALRRLLSAGTDEAARTIFEQEVAPLSRRLQSLLGSYIERKQQLLARAEATATETGRQIAFLLLVIAAANALLAVAAWWLVRRTLAHIMETERSLRETVRSRDAFLAAVGHELRTPLSVLKLNADLLRRKPDSGDVAVPRPLVDMIGRNVDAVVSLVDRLLDVSLIARGQLKLRCAQVDLSAVARDAVERASLQMGGRTCEVILEASAPVLGRWDPVRLGQVVDNLVGNALRHACAGQITVCVDRVGPLARLRVRDRGAGIPEADRRRVFERFERLGDSVDGSGLGLGLAIVRDIVEAHGGTIRVEDAPGGGAEFVVELPTGV